MNGASLWSERRSSYWQEARGYLKLILNSGFVASVYFLFIFLTVYYQQFIADMPANFPVAELLTALFAWRLTQGKVRTFVKQADVVFLLPYEAHLGEYFQKSIRYSLIWQCGFIVLIMLSAGPMFTARIGEGATFWLALVLLLIVKAWNLYCVWEEQRLTGSGDRISHILLRLLVNAVFAYLLFSNSPFWLLLLMLIGMGLLYVFYWRMFSKRHSLKWERLIEVENSMVMFFYRIANVFADVPALRHKVRERRYLQWLIPVLGGNKRTVYHHLFARSFIRANDYLGVYFRLMLVGGVLLYFLPAGWMQVAIAVLFTHMTMMQLSTLSYHYRTSMWVDLYPIEPLGQKQALTFIALRLLFVLALVFSVIVVFTAPVLYAVVTLVFTGLLAFSGSTSLIHRKKGKYSRVR